MEKIIYFTYDSNCKYCDKFSPVAEKLHKEYTDENFIKLNCENADNKFLAKRIFGGKTVPFIVSIKDKKVNTLSDISDMTYDDIIALIKK